MNSFIKWLVGSIGGFLALLAGAIADPTGFINYLVCGVIDIVFAVLPSTPDSLKLGAILTSFSQQFPIFGWGILLDIIQTCITMLLVVLVIKVYKLIPFKAS